MSSPSEEDTEGLFYVDGGPGDDIIKPWRFGSDE